MRTRRSLLCVVVAALLGCEEGPDQIFRPLPEGLDRIVLNGLKPGGYQADGQQPFEFKTSGKQEGTAKLCEGDEQKERWSKMIKEPIIPTVGAGGLDLRGEPVWSGMTVDDAQQQLCQMSLLDSNLGCWGDNCELIVVFDEKTRLILALVPYLGYEGKITAGDYVVGINSAIQVNGKKLVNPLSDDSLRALNVALLKAFRPEMQNAESRDCIKANSCVAEVYKTYKALRFLDLSMTIILEPEADRVTQIGVQLKRAFAFGSADVTFPAAATGGLAPMPKIAYSGPCAPTLGSPWSQISGACMGQDKPEKAQTQADGSGEVITVDMGGLGLYLTRPSLAKNAIFPDDVKPEAADEIAAMGFFGSYEGGFVLPQGVMLQRYTAALVPAVVQLVPELGQAMGPVPGDPASQTHAEALAAKLAKIVPIGDPDRVKLGAQKVEDCNVAGPCEQTTIITRTRQLALDAVTAAGVAIPERLKDPNFFVELYLGALMATFNDDLFPTPAELRFFPADDSAEQLYAVFTRELNGERYAVRTAYEHVTDQLIYLFFKQAPMRTEKILWQDASLKQFDGKPGDGKFRLWNLARSPRLGLANKIQRTADYPDLRKATIAISMGTTQEEVLVSYNAENSLSGFGIPVKGQRDVFVPASYYGFTGNVIAAGIWATTGIVRAVYSSAFYDKLDFCGVKVGLWDEADAFLKQLPPDCEKIVGFSENGKVLTSISGYVASEPYKIGLRLYVTANRIDGAYYWGEDQ